MLISTKFEYDEGKSFKVLQFFIPKTMGCTGNKYLIAIATFRAVIIFNVFKGVK